MAKDKTTMKYTQQQTYFFDEKASAPFSENDKIVVLNVALNVSKLAKYYLIINSYKLAQHTQPY